MSLFPQLPPSASACTASQWNWGEQRLNHVVSHVHAHAGRVDEANQAQEAALSAYPDGNYQGRSQVEFHRSTALIRAADIDSGANHLVSTIERLEPWQRQDGIIRQSAMSTLGLIPWSQRDRTNVRLAHETVAATERNR